MKRFVIPAGLLAALVTGIYFLKSGPQPATEPDTPLMAPEENVTLRVNADAQDVFKRAFWRRPAPEDRILNAERREWVSEEDGVRHWQWFLAVEPGAALSEYLREENPFSLVKADRLPTTPRLAPPPAWFPAPTGSAHREIWCSRDGDMTLIFDTAQSRLFASGTGHGFATASRP